MLLQAVTLDDAGLYTCVANNSVGTERVSTSVVIHGTRYRYTASRNVDKQLSDGKLGPNYINVLQTDHHNDKQ